MAMAPATAAEADVQLVPRHWAQVTPTSAEDTWPTTKFQGWERGA
jgi:hypothetical protein